MTGSPTLRTGGVLLGVGLGGLVDGILLHQVLQWHHFVAARLAPDDLAALRTNVFWDGVFHVSTTVVLVVGALLVWHARRDGRAGTAPPGRLGGYVLVGWGAFNIADVVVFHWLLDLHVLRMGVPNPEVYDLAWVASGVVLIGLGWWSLRASARRRRWRS